MFQQWVPTSTRRSTPLWGNNRPVYRITLERHRLANAKVRQRVDQEIIIKDISLRNRSNWNQIISKRYLGFIRYIELVCAYGQLSLHHQTCKRDCLPIMQVQDAGEFSGSPKVSLASFCASLELFFWAVVPHRFFLADKLNAEQSVNHKTWVCGLQIKGERPSTPNLGPLCTQPSKSSN